MQYEILNFMTKIHHFDLKLVKEERNYFIFISSVYSEIKKLETQTVQNRTEIEI